MGGTWKQEKIAFSKKSAWGAYGRNTVYLYAFPKRCLRLQLDRLPKTDLRHCYERVGAEYVRDKEGWVCTIDEYALKRFYLQDVLIHEIGHHVDRLNFSRKNIRQEENFAKWFVREYGFKCFKSSREHQ